MTNRRIPEAALAALILCAFAPAHAAAQAAPVTGATTTLAPPAVASTPTASARPVERLTLQQCLDIARQKSPAIAAAGYAVGAADARIGQAQSA